MSKKLAYIYSRIFDPFLLFAIIPLLSVLLRGDLTSSQTAKWLIFVFTIGGVIPFLCYLWLLAHHKISGIELKQRKERNGIFIVMAICWLAIYLFAVKINGPQLIQATYFAGSIIIMLYLAINQHIKISGHSGFFTAFLIFLSLLVSPYFLFGLVLVAVMFWARMKLKLHTPLELILGTIIAGGIMLAVLIIFGY